MTLEVFTLRNQVVAEYRDSVESFVTIRSSVPFAEQIMRFDDVFGNVG